MRDFTAGSGRLRSLSIAAKILYTAFALSALAGLVLSWRLYGAIVADAGPAAYYGGVAAPAPAPAPPTPPAPDIGPELDLPEEASAPRVLVEQISERKLLEITHFHLFSVPVYVLILAHLWLLAKLPTWLHTAGVVAAVATSALHLAAPWIVRSAPAAAPLLPLSGVAMLATLALMALVPTADMWLPRRLRRAPAPDDSIS